MAVEETEFTQVFRGYDKDEVDRSINALRREIIAANNATGELQKENKRLLTRIEELTAELEEVGSPTFSGLGTKLDAMGDRKEAQAIFERITREFPSSEAAPLAQVRLGDLLWADGKQDEAKKAYEELAVKFPDMPEFQSISQDRLGWIAASLPTKEVDPPPTPKVEPKPGDVPAIPGMPKLNLTPGASGLGATIAPPGAPAAPARGAHGTARALVHAQQPSHGQEHHAPRQRHRALQPLHGALVPQALVDALQPHHGNDLVPLDPSHRHPALTT